MNRAIEILKDYKKELEDIKKYYQQSTDDLETIEDIDQALQLLQTDVRNRRELLIGYIMNEQRIYCGKPDRKLSEDLADDYIANL